MWLIYWSNFVKSTWRLLDLSQMFRQLVLREENRPLHPFLLRDLDSSKEPEVRVPKICVWRLLSSFLYTIYLVETCIRSQGWIPFSSWRVRLTLLCGMSAVNTSETAKETQRQLSEMGENIWFCTFVNGYLFILRYRLRIVPRYNGLTADLRCEKWRVPVLLYFATEWFSIH